MAIISSLDSLRVCARWSSLHSSLVLVYSRHFSFALPKFNICSILYSNILSFRWVSFRRIQHHIGQSTSKILWSVINVWTRCHCQLRRFRDFTSLESSSYSSDNRDGKLLQILSQNMSQVSPLTLPLPMSTFFFTSVGKRTNKITGLTSAST